MVGWRKRRRQKARGFVLSYFNETSQTISKDFFPNEFLEKINNLIGMREDSNELCMILTCNVVMNAEKLGEAWLCKHFVDFSPRPAQNSIKWNVAERTVKLEIFFVWRERNQLTLQFSLCAKHSRSVEATKRFNYHEIKGFLCFPLQRTFLLFSVIHTQQLVLGIERCEVCKIDKLRNRHFDRISIEHIWSVSQHVICVSLRDSSALFYLLINELFEWSESSAFLVTLSLDCILFFTEIWSFVLIRISIESLNARG